MCVYVNLKRSKRFLVGYKAIERKQRTTNSLAIGGDPSTNWLLRQKDSFPQIFRSSPLTNRLWTSLAGRVSLFSIEPRAVAGVGAKFAKCCHIALGRWQMGHGTCFLAKETICVGEQLLNSGSCV